MSDFCLYEWNDLEKKKVELYACTNRKKNVTYFFLEKGLAFILSCISLYMIDELREKKNFFKSRLEATLWESTFHSVET